MEFVVFIPFSTYFSASKNPFMHPVEHGSENGGHSSTPEESAGSLQRDVFAAPLAIHDARVPEAAADTTPIQDLEHAVYDIDSVSDAVSSLRLV